MEQGLQTFLLLHNVWVWNNAHGNANLSKQQCWGMILNRIIQHLTCFSIKIAQTIVCQFQESFSLQGIFIKMLCFNLLKGWTPGENLLITCHGVQKHACILIQQNFHSQSRTYSLYVSNQTSVWRFSVSNILHNVFDCLNLADSSNQIGLLAGVVQISQWTFSLKCWHKFV